MGSRSYKTEAVVLRSFRFGEADRVVHLFTKEQGRLGAIAKGVRRARSRFGARLEPFSHVDVVLHDGRGELSTVTGVDLVRSHQSLAGDSYSLGVGSIGLEAVSRLFIEHDPSVRAFHALVRFLDLLDGPVAAVPAGHRRAARATPANPAPGSSPPRLGSGSTGPTPSSEGATARVSAGDPTLDPLALSFQLKLLWLAGYLPHLASCASCGGTGALVAFSPSAGGAVCRDCATGALETSGAGFLGIRALLEAPLAGATEAGLSTAAARETLRMIESVYEYHGGFRMRTLARR